MLSSADPQPSAELGAAAATGVEGETGLAKDNKTDKTAGTQLLDRTVAIMKLLGDAGQAGLRPIEVSKQLGLTTTTAHRIMTALERHGLVEREQATHRYRLGLSLFAMGAKAADGTGLRSLCRPALMRLAAETGDTVFLMARSGFNVVCVDRQEGTYVLDSLTGHIGGQIPLGVGSASLAVLAFLPEQEARAIVAANAPRYAAFNGLSVEEIDGQLVETRARGFALDQGRLVAGISALAVPIAPKGRDVVAALAINMTSSRLPDERIESIADRLKAEVAIVASELNPLQFAARRTRSVADLADG